MADSRVNRDYFNSATKLRLLDSQNGPYTSLPGARIVVPDHVAGEFLALKPQGFGEGSLRPSITGGRGACQARRGIVGPMLVREKFMDRGEHVSVAWAGIREGLKRDCGARLFDHWLKPIMLAGISDKGDVVRLTLPTEFHANWVRAHYADRLLLAWRGSMPSIREIRIEV